MELQLAEPAQQVAYWDLDSSSDDSQVDGVGAKEPPPFACSTLAEADSSLVHEATTTANGAWELSSSSEASQPVTPRPHQRPSLAH